jgi:L-arabinokinase
MGGIADYSGSLVLQRPIAEATFVALQRTNLPSIEVTSLGRKPCTLALAALQALDTYEDARRLLNREEDNRWMAYVAGIFIALRLERGIAFPGGARIVIDSGVPEGKGVSSSAAVATATAQAAARAFGIPIAPMDLALLCQKAENLVAGAPCGAMDPVTCVFGEKDRLLALLCQPAELLPFVDVPGDLAFWGLDSGERHAVGGADYGAVRTGAFMGRRLISAMTGAPIGYLANIAPDEFEREYLSRLPDEVPGDEFLSRFGNTADTVTTVDPSRVYPVRQPTAHPVYEHRRVQMFRQLLASPNEEQRMQLGELMYLSHAGYAACGLGSRGTDLLVDLVRVCGPPQGLYGARITGGGSGGTVAVLGRSDAAPAIAGVVAAYESIAGYRPRVFSGSSDGVLKSGCETVDL